MMNESVTSNMDFFLGSLGKTKTDYTFKPESSVRADKVKDNMQESPNQQEWFTFDTVYEGLIMK